MSVQELSERYLQFILNEFPEFATYKGFRLQEDKLDLFDLGLYKRRGEFCQKLHADCLQLKENELTRSERITLAVLKHISSTITEGLKYTTQCFGFNYHEGPDLHFSRFTMHYMILETEKDYTNFLCRLGCIPQQIEGRIELLKEGVRTGVLPYKDVLIPKVENRLRQDLATIPSEMRFYSRLKKMPSSIPETTRENIRKEAITIIRDQIQPSFQTLLDFLKREYFPALTRESICIDSIPGPPLRYKTVLRFHCDVDWSPEKIHQLGLDMVKKYRDRISEIMASQSFAGSLMEFSSHLSKQAELNFEKVEDIVPHCQKVIEERIAPVLPKMFHIPKDTPLVFHEESSPSMPARAIYNGPPLDNSKPAQLVLSVHNPTTFAKAEIMVLLLHETSPGHHFETCAMSANDSLPTFRRLKDDRTYTDVPCRYPMNTAYTEGWGLYCESLGEELGLYENQLEQYWYLTYNLVRSARAVVDTGIHHFGWSRQEAENYYDENVPLIPERRDIEIMRFIGNPGQCSSYMVGFINIKQMRERAMEKLGSCFDIRDFHQMVLSEGKVPLNVLERMVDDFVEDKLSAT